MLLADGRDSTKVKSLKKNVFLNCEVKVYRALSGLQINSTQDDKHNTIWLSGHKNTKTGENSGWFKSEGCSLKNGEPTNRLSEVLYGRKDSPEASIG
jgi:hypothetical protein